MSRLSEVLEARLDFSQAATKKFAKIEAAEIDGRVCNGFQLYGASRTGRWAHRGIQPGNLKRPTMEDPETAAALLLRDPEAFRHEHTLEDLGSLVRSAICASPGRRLVVSDYSNIESRILGWLSNCERLNKTFASDRDPYKDFAVEWLEKTYEEVTKEERNLCKPPALGCGYGLGPVGLQKYAHSMGVQLDDQHCDSAVKAFRTAYWEIPVLWRAVERSFRASLFSWEPIQLLHGLVFQSRNPFTTIRLPSGRRLWYFTPGVDEYDSLYYWGQDAFTGKWGKIRTYGARLVENIVQAVARDVLRFGLKTADTLGFNIVGHVHDEIISEESESNANGRLLALNRILSTAPRWAPGLKLNAEGYVATRYRKG